MFHRPALLTERHRLGDFDCGIDELNQFLVKRALPNQESGFSRTYVIAEAEGAVVGYHSLCSSMITRADAPRKIGGHGAPTEIPVILLARLAVDSRHRGKGLGVALLRHALQVSALASVRVGTRAVLVHAIDDSAARFYQRHRFQAARGLERTLLISMADVMASIRSALGEK